MRIAHKKGEEPIKKRSQFDQDVEDFMKLFITQHNRKIQREKKKSSQVLTYLN